MRDTGENQDVLMDRTIWKNQKLALSLRLEQMEDDLNVLKN